MRRYLTQAEGRKRRAAREAASWHQRLQEGLSLGEISRYMHWLQDSPENVRAIQFMTDLCEKLRAGRSTPRLH